MADIPQSLRSWSATAGSNSPNDTTTVGAGLDDNLRVQQATVRQFLAWKGSNVASAATTDLTTMDGHDATLTGNVTITGFGVEGAGIHYRLTCASNPLIVHNSAAINCPGGANLQTSAGDVIEVTSEGAGVWRVTDYQPNVSFTGTGSVVRASSPALSGTPTAPTAATATATTQIATTEFISNILAPITRYYTTAGSVGWAKPDGLKWIDVQVWGAGGAGGSANSGGGTSSTGGSGGGGGYTRKRILAAALAASVTVTVGAANGNLSAFQGHCTATGGSSGSNGGADTTGNPGGGGVGQNGDLNLTGATAGAVSAGLSGFGYGGSTAGTTSNGGAATGFSTGGGGAHDESGAGRSGGDGAPGAVIITEYYV